MRRESPDTVVRMDDTDGGSDYYMVPDEWVDWIRTPAGTPPPADLAAAQVAEFGKVLDDEFSRRTLQAVAVEVRLVGDSIADVIDALEGGPIGREVRGTSY